LHVEEWLDALHDEDNIAEKLNSAIFQHSICLSSNTEKQK